MCCFPSKTKMNKYKHFTRKTKCTHYLLIDCFQRIMAEFKSIEPNLTKTTSLKLKENSFANNLPCDEPSNCQFRCTEGCKNVSCSSSFIKNLGTKLLMQQYYFRSLEHLPAKDKVATYVLDDMNAKLIPDIHEDESVLKFRFPNICLLLVLPIH